MNSRSSITTKRKWSLFIQSNNNNNNYNKNKIKQLYNYYYNNKLCQINKWLHYCASFKYCTYRLEAKKKKNNKNNGTLIRVK